MFIKRGERLFGLFPLAAFPFLFCSVSPDDANIIYNACEGGHAWADSYVPGRDSIRLATFPFLFALYRLIVRTPSAVLLREGLGRADANN